MATTEIDSAKLEAMIGKTVVNAGVALWGLLAYAGDRLGLYSAMAGAGPLTPAELAKKTHTNERMIREWALANAAQGYLDYDAKTGAFTLSPEAAALLADTTEAPAGLVGFFSSIAAVYRNADKVVDAVRTGKGRAWGDQHPDLFIGTERFFRPGYEADLVATWLPALQGVTEKLKAGATVADVGCGHGASTIIMAKAFPKSKFTGFDSHGPSIERARKLAANEGVADRVTFEVASATEIPGSNYDLVSFFDCLHDMSDPQGAVTHARKIVAKDGTILLVEPASTDQPEVNIANPVGAVFYAASALICTPCSLADGGPGLGAQAGPGRLGELFTKAGFTTFRPAHTTPFNIVFEAKP
ncbi:MAG: class I SAM-dependent methyltransferase [Actinomycetota bacterium]